jgi:hypothetical protein
LHRTGLRPPLNSSIVGQLAVMADSDDYEDPELEARWLAEQRGNVQRYLQEQGVHHRGVSSAAVWFVAPYISVWTVGSVAAPGAIGWWAISGDLPTDYLSGQGATDARSALAAFSRRWRDVAAYMLRGETHPTIAVGSPEDTYELGDLLQRRARILDDWAGDDEIW